jgi:CheY-like chemotaxis protein
MNPPLRPYRVLIVDDNLGDIILLRKAFQQINAPINLYEEQEGRLALARLNREGSYRDCPMPDLVLLDLNMPNIDGRSILKEIKSSDKLQHMPVIIVSSTRDVEDFKYCIKHQANAMVVKPDDLEGYFELGESIYKFWLKIANPDQNLIRA